MLSQRNGDGFRPVGDAEFLKERFDVLFYHVEADAELFGDVGV